MLEILKFWTIGLARGNRQQGSLIWGFLLLRYLPSW